ncbi:hypothetical protein [Marinicella litoralis]|uniref:Cytochrome oxidase Cu insertion factor (SCO1/SenC/PrrC family) n=1 Tax=Marinicella litoralis TaxID=644220 RepID=A0A4R6XRF3_9GAMM|nr:hypothetical protein [Marinicella litoralis]TDR20574.1 hypothetical protein C8D91_1548 [Marinicella litoralis]
MQAKTKNRLTIVLTVLLFTAPVVVAYLLSSGLIKYQPDAKKNNGHFVSPLVKLADYSDQPWVDSLIGHWTLIRRVPEPCANQCQVMEDELNRYKLSLGHRSNKLNLMLLSDGYLAESPDLFPNIKKVNIAKNSQLKSVFDRLSEDSLKAGHGLYVVAPEGYLMMSFAPENTSTEIIRDLSLLVKRKGD